MGAGNGARFSGRAAGSTLNHRAVSPAPVYFIFIRMYVHVSVCGYQQKEVLVVRNWWYKLPDPGGGGGAQVPCKSSQSS